MYCEIKYCLGKYWIRRRRKDTFDENNIYKRPFVSTASSSCDEVSLKTFITGHLKLNVLKIVLDSPALVSSQSCLIIPKSVRLKK